MLLAFATALLLAPTVDAPSNTAPAADKPADRKICRKQIETGSLIKGKKLCYTARQWQKLADASRDEIESRSSSGSASGK